MTEHIPAVCSTFLSSNRWGECSCGWLGEERATEAEVEADIESHLRADTVSVGASKPSGSDGDTTP